MSFHSRQLPFSVTMEFGTPLPANAINKDRGDGFPGHRFGHGYAEFDSDSDVDLKRPGAYATYSRRTRLMIMGNKKTVTTPDFWVPMVVFIPDDETRLPEVALSWSPVDRGRTPILVENNLTHEELVEQLFVDVNYLFGAFARYYDREGERYEIVYERELKRRRKSKSLST